MTYKLLKTCSRTHGPSPSIAFKYKASSYLKFLLEYKYHVRPRAYYNSGFSSSAHVTIDDVSIACCLNLLKVIWFGSYYRFSFEQCFMFYTFSLLSSDVNKSRHKAKDTSNKAKALKKKLVKAKDPTNKD